MNELNWSDIAFGSKRALRDLKATFIPTPRTMSIARFTQLIKQYLPSGNIVVGCADEAYIDGFSGQSQFKTLQSADIMKLVSKVNDSASTNKITLLHCRQSDISPILNKIKFRLVLLVNGSWQYSFHMRSEYYTLVSCGIPFEFISPFVDENEAQEFANKFGLQTTNEESNKLLTDIEMIRIANQVAKNSFDNTFQTGASLGKKIGDKYELIASSYNKTVPYQTFAWHFGALRERHLSPMGDLNYYDTVHAEVMLLLQAQKTGLKLDNTSLFINLLPCPACARMLCETDIAEVVYSLDHSDGYAVALLEKSGKLVRRIVDSDSLIKKEG